MTNFFEKVASDEISLKVQIWACDQIKLWAGTGAQSKVRDESFFIVLFVHVHYMYHVHVRVHA